MKKLISLIFLLFIPLTSFAWAPLSWNTSSEASDVVATLESGTYDRVIDVKLIANDDGAKIFYYTDTIGRFDEQIEYKAWTKIIVKENTTLNYHSVSRNQTASLIKENIYNFAYPEKIHLWYNWNTLVVTNNEVKEIDLRWWTINDAEILYKTIIEIWWKYNYPFSMNTWDIVTLSSPDKKVKIAFKYILAEKKIEENKKTENIISETVYTKEDTQLSNTETITWNIAENINSWNIETNSQDENIINNEITNNVSKNNNTLNNNLKTSILDSAQEKKTNPLVLLIWIIMFLAVVWWAYVKLEKK